MRRGTWLLHEGRAIQPLPVFGHFPEFLGTLWGRKMEKNRQIAAGLRKLSKYHKFTRPA
jgi:hypothetical protein